MNNMMKRSMTETCDEYRSTAGFDKFEFRSSEIIVGCKCVRNDGMQHECRRIKCMGRPDCVAYPWPRCLPSQPCPSQGLQDDCERTGVPPPNTAVGSNEFMSSTTVFAVTANDQSSVHKRRAAARHMLRWAMAQYDDRLALKKLSVPCRYHVMAKKSPTKISCITTQTLNDVKPTADQVRKNDAFTLKQ